MDKEEEIDELIGRLKKALGENADANGPIGSPVARFMHLPEPTRRFLEELRIDDLDDLRKVLKAYRQGSVLFWFLRWALFTMAGAFVATVAFGEKIVVLLSWLKGAR